MHAIRLHAFGPPGNLRYETVPDPEPAPGQVRIRVAAAGVHLLDTILRAGTSDGPMPPAELPTIPGREVAGTVDALGDGVDRGWLGTRVVTHLGLAPGGYAELAVRDADALHALPDGLAGDVAVAMIGTGRTAVGVLARARLTADDVVLVTAAAGGLGALFVQAARDAGAYVVGAAGGEEKIRRVWELGADAAVDYRDEDWPAHVRATLEGRELTVALDGVGGTLGRQALELLGPGGRLILYGWSSGAATRFDAGDLYRAGLTATVALAPGLLRRPGVLRGLETEALAAAAAGRLRPLLTRFALRDAAAAHAALEERRTVGKVVLVP